MYEYRELRIRIERDAAGTFKTYAAGPSGETSGEFTLPFSDLELENMLLRISGQLARGVRRVETPETSLVTDFGGKLFGALFQGRIRDLYHDSLAGAEAQGKGLRITLALTDVPELMQLPWEFLYDDPNFLSMSVWTPVVRYLDLSRARDPLTVEPPLRILAMVSSPSDVAVLDVERERLKLEHALGGLVAAKAVEIDWLEVATLRELMRRLQSRTYHIFHYIGHGAYDPNLEDGVLLLEDENGKGDRVSGVKLGTILADHVSLRLAVLNSCEGARGAAEDPFSGVASSLVQKQIPAVVAMQFEITDEAAIDFAEEFYTALGAGYPVDSALAEGRKAIYSAGNDLEWGTPVLLLRVRDGRIFDIPVDLRTPKNGAKRKKPKEPKPRRRVEIRAPKRRRLWIALGAAAVLAVAAIGAGLALSRGSGGGSSGEWSSVAAGDAVLDGGGHQEMRAITKTADGAFAVGRDGKSPAFWTYDGSDWSRISTDIGRGTANGVAGRGRLVVVGASVPAGDARIWRRDEQGKWGQAPCSGCGGPEIQAAYGALALRNGTFLAVGADANTDDGSFDAAVWRSRDGDHWQRVGIGDPELGGKASQVMKGVIEVGGASGHRLWAFGRDGTAAAVWTSDDGEHWTEENDPVLRAQTADGFQEIDAAVHIGTRLVGVGWAKPSRGRTVAAVWIRSDTTQSWERVPLRSVVPGEEQEMLALADVRPQLVAVGYDTRGDVSQAAVWRSSLDSRTWTRVSSDSFAPFNGAAMSGVAVLGDTSLISVGVVGVKQEADAASWSAKGNP
jgi:hypothetical protein